MVHETLLLAGMGVVIYAMHCMSIHDPPASADVINLVLGAGAALIGWIKPQKPTR